MKRFAFMLAIGLFSALGSNIASAGVIWKGTFEGGDLSKWSRVEQVNPDRLQVVGDPAGGKGRVLKVKVVQGDNPIKASGNRNELVYTGDQIKEGDERFYQWSTMWPKDYQSADTWQLFTQWHHTGTSGSPPVEFYAIGDQIYLRCSGEVVWSAPLERGNWHNFMLHIVWSPNKKEGFVELFEDGKIALPKTYAQTMFPGQGVYLKQGLYRNAKITQTQTLYQSGVVVATKASDLSGSYDSKGSEGWSDMSKSQASGGCSSGGLAATWPALGAGLILLALRQRRMKRAQVEVRS